VKNIESFEPESNIDFYKNLLKKFIRSWYLFAISLALTLSAGLYIYKSASPLYSNNSLMLIAEERTGRQNRGDLLQFEMFNIESTIEDELGIIQSFPIINKTIRQLDLTTSYYKSSGLTTIDIYKNNPFIVLSDPKISQVVNLDFTVEILSNNKFRISTRSDRKVYLYNLANNEVTGELENVNFSGEYKFGDEIILKDTKFKLLLNGNFAIDKLLEEKYYFKFNNLEQLTYQYQEALSVERTSIQSSLVNLEIKNANPVLATNFLNKLTEVYLNQNLEKKNIIATRTIEFIDDQIAEVADSLYFTADMLKDFRTQNKVMDINFLSQSVYNQMTLLQDQRAELEVNAKYYDYIKEYFENNNDLSDILAPSAMGVDDTQLISLINQLTELNAKRSLLLNKNPAIHDLNIQITKLKETILENIDYIVNTSNITINDIDNRIAKLNSQMSKLPTTEKELINITRKFDINDAIYTFLLQRRSAAEIARASNRPDYEVVDPAKLSSVLQVAPKQKMILLGALFLGLMFPIGFILLQAAINETVTERNDIAKVTNLPLLASIVKNETKSIMPLTDFPKSLVSESFRSLRTSLQFFHKDKDRHNFLVTSAFSGDGKSFLSINLAIAYSYFGKRTLLLEFDLRKPKIASYLNLDNSKGLSSYLINDASLEDIIQNTGIKNLDIITSGELPPNPVELMASENTRNLMEILQSIYDYIIIDSPPIGIVTDSYLLMNYSDINIFAVRLNHTNKKLFTSIMNDIKQKEIQNFGIVINDDGEQMQSSYYSSYDSKKSFIMKKLNTLKRLMTKG